MAPIAGNDTNPVRSSIPTRRRANAHVNDYFSSVPGRLRLIPPRLPVARGFPARARLNCQSPSNQGSLGQRWFGPSARLRISPRSHGISPARSGLAHRRASHRVPGRQTHQAPARTLDYPSCQPPPSLSRTMPIWPRGPQGHQSGSGTGRSRRADIARAITLAAVGSSPRFSIVRRRPEPAKGAPRRCRDALRPPLTEPGRKSPILGS